MRFNSRIDGSYSWICFCSLHIFPCSLAVRSLHSSAHFQENICYKSGPGSAPLGCTSAGCCCSPTGVPLQFRPAHSPPQCRCVPKPRPTAAYLHGRYIRVQSIQSSPTWTPWQDIDTMCRLSAAAATLLPCFAGRSSCPAGTYCPAGTRLTGKSTAERPGVDLRSLSPQRLQVTNFH